MKIKKFNEEYNKEFFEIERKVYLKRYSINDEEDIEFLLQDAEYLLKTCKINHVIYYKYFEAWEPSHFIFKISAFPVNMDERVILDQMNYESLIKVNNVDKYIKSISSLWTEIEYDDIEPTINAQKFNI